MNRQLIITPRTKVLELIEAYPRLEEILVGYVPAFGKLKNPVLKNTVGRVTTLQQASAIANINVEDLVNRLRKEVGQDTLSGITDTEYIRTKPDWFSDDLVKGGLDARNMLATGEHPVSQVIADLNSMEKGTIYRLSAPFLPAPLIDKSTSLGIQHWVKKIDDESYLVYFYRE